MQTRDYRPLITALADAYIRHSPRSAQLHERAKRVMIDGGNHPVRLMEPFPPRITGARGAYLTDEDGHQILDFWQGHFANLLGHNPQVVTEALARAFGDGYGLQAGFTEGVQIEAAELLSQRTGSERVRLTTSGTLSTMYAILLACAYSGREQVMKAGGGWHGAQPWGLKGVGFSPSAGFNEVDSAGIPVALSSSVVVTHFNDPEMLRVQFHEYGDRLACLILEPIMGGGGGMPATVEYLRTARELTEKYGAVLIFDEVITGFRFRAGSAGALYGIQPDLTTMGKIIGGGMPLAAVGGREVIMRLTGRASGGKVKFLGGTYSGHPSTMVAAKTMIEYLVAHEPEIYPRLARLGEQASRLVEDTFAQEGIYARCTGAGNAVVPHSSIIRVHFPYLKEQSLNSPNDVMDPTKCDVTLSEKVLRLALITEDINTEHGLGALSTAHTDADLAQLGMALQRVAQRIRPYVF